MSAMADGTEPEDRADSADDADSADEAGADAVLEALWKRVLEAWDDERVHAAVLDHAIRTEALPEIAGRYRALAADPEKGARAKAKLDAVVVAATNLLWLTKMPVPGKVPLSITLSAVGVSLFLLSWLAWAVLGPHR
ncbi:MAG TPA: hypothetical protein VK841_13530 [Polyangiaceae bacterium]|jgi:hypothetical protein|nr:hypothetical protein [Polyangiaceae bacterium]